MSIFDQARNVLKDLQSKATSVASNFNSIPSNPQSWQVKQPLINTPLSNAKPINYGQVAQNVGNQIGNQVASIPYAMANNARDFRARNAIPIDFNKQAIQNKTEYQTYQKASPIGKLGIDSIMGEGTYQPIAKQSAQTAPWYYDTTPAPQTNPYLEGLKQQILNGPNVRPQAKAYLSKVPIVYENMVKEQALGLSHGGTQAKNPYIGISDTFNKSADNMSRKPLASYVQHQTKQLENVIQHELLHETPRMIPTELFHPSNQPVVQQYVNRWGKEYMQRPDALVEEMFAEQDLPPAYYWHIYQQVNPRATQQNFVDYLKSYFVNNINTPALAQPTTGKGTAGRAGTVVPNSGGGKVEN